MGTTGPPPNRSPPSTANPAACAARFEIVPAKPSEPAPRSDSAASAGHPGRCRGPNPRMRRVFAQHLGFFKPLPGASSSRRRGRDRGNVHRGRPHRGAGAGPARVSRAPSARGTRRDRIRQEGLGGWGRRRRRSGRGARRGRGSRGAPPVGAATVGAPPKPGAAWTPSRRWLEPHRQARRQRVRRIRRACRPAPPHSRLRPRKPPM